jgi:hypothetical protein
VCEDPLADRDFVSFQLGPNGAREEIREELEGVNGLSAA